MEKKRIIRLSIASWIASRRKLLPDKYLRYLSNLVNKDFETIPLISPTHLLESSGVCMDCNRTGISFSDFEKSFMEWGNNILRERPTPNMDLDQEPVTNSQAFLNIAYMISNISNETTFAFLGDDDFHSLLLAKMLPNLKISVFETDKRIISKIKTIANDYSLNVSVIELNLKDIVPQKYFNKYDSFYSDPPYSKKGIYSFLYNGLLLLKKKRTSWGALAVPFTPLPLQVKELILEIQLYITQNGILIEEVIPFFKKSPSDLGINSGILKFRIIKRKTISSPPSSGNLYKHFY